MAKKANHIAVIMDGNGRWASSLGQPRVFGHKIGSRVVNDLAKSAVKLGVRNLTVFALSCENMSRPKEEIDSLQALFIECIEQHVDDLMHQGVRLRFIGNISSLDPNLQDVIDKSQAKTQNNKRLIMTVAINFSGRWHILETTKQLMAKKRALSEEDIQAAFNALLPSEPDILIRTGGERRLSNFLLYHLAYTELFFLDVKWPEFTEAHLRSVLEQFELRDRRYGHIGADT
ncbi:MAG: polyprenyl diphosphate synthase [Pseudomonadota bacterium]|nr:polyprenyl diphosphate synthase [Pseudomonadota bacterium]